MKSVINPVKNKKALIVLGCAVAVMFVLLWLNSLDWDGFAVKVTTGENTPAGEKNIDFYTPDYESDIFENRTYLEKNRYISYTDGAGTVLIADENYELYGKPVQLFAEYFDALTHGDSEKLNLLYTDEFFSKHDKYEKFTMQKIYNIELSITAADVIDDGSEYNGYTRYLFDVRYMIMENDGTFRRDIESNAAVPLIFELLSYGGEIKINSVTPYTYSDID